MTEVEGVPAPVPASSVQTTPVQTVPTEQVPVWKVVAERACLVLLGVCIGLLSAASVVFR